MRAVGWAQAPWTNDGQEAIQLRGSRGQHHPEPGKHFCWRIFSPKVGGGGGGVSRSPAAWGPATHILMQRSLWGQTLSQSVPRSPAYF